MSTFRDDTSSDYTLRVNAIVHELKSRINMALSELEGEYRVTYLEEQGEKAEESAYYTNDLQDAIRTAEVMRSVRRLRKIRTRTREHGKDRS